MGAQPSQLGSIVVVGGSIAGLTATQELRRQGYAGTIHVLDRDRDSPYRRPEVSKSALIGDTAAPVSIAWPSDLDDVRVLGFDVQGVDVARRVLRGELDGVPDEIPFDGLVIATGSAARRMLPQDSTVKVHTLRSLSDARLLAQRVGDASRILVIGAGFIGLEVAAKMRALGKSVVVVEKAPLPLLPQLGAEVATFISTRHRADGIEFWFDETIASLSDRADGRVSVRTSKGRDEVADVVVEAVGSQPNLDWLSATGLDLSQGLRCDEHCRVEGLPNVVGAGDVVNWSHPLFGRRMRVEHWTNAIEQGVYAARALLGQLEPRGFEGLPYFWSQQAGLNIQSLGSTLGHDQVTVVETTETSLFAEYRRHGTLVAAVGVNCGRQVMKARKAIISELTASVTADASLV